MIMDTNKKIEIPPPLFDIDKLYMHNSRLVKISKYLSKHLRHQPDRLGIKLRANASNFY